VVVQILSDIHIDKHDDLGASFWRTLRKGDADTLVMAGDICELRFPDRLREVLAAVAPRYKHIVYVPGNHEFWGMNPFHAWKRLKKIQREVPNFHPLNNELVELDGQRFYGGTMWFAAPPPELAHMKKKWPDYLYVEKFEPWAYDSNRLFREEFEQVVAGDVVITHHMPSYQSVAQRYIGDKSNHFYVSPMEDQILHRKPAIWVHGHTHNSFDYTLGETRVVCNPLGYPHETQSQLAFVNPKLLSL